MEPSYVMRIGPFDGKDGRIFEYIVYPGHEGHLQYFAPDDDDAFDAILAEYEADELVCEKQLEQAGARHNVPSRQLNDPARHGLSLFALDRLPGAPFSALTEEMLVHHLLETAELFLGSEAMGGPEPQRWMQVSVKGTTSFTTQLCIQTDPPDGSVVTMLMGHGEGLRADVDAAKEIQRRDRLTLSFSEGPAFVLDALARGYEASAIPVPWRFVQGKREPVADMQLAILIALLAALQHMGRGSKWAQSHFSIRGIDVYVELQATASTARE